jgi:hypothetical protein
MYFISDSKSETGVRVYLISVISGVGGEKKSPINRGILIGHWGR